MPRRTWLRLRLAYAALLLACAPFAMLERLLGRQ